MKILSVDTSSIVATAAIVEDEKLVAEYVLNNKLTHSQTLMPIVDEIIKSSNTDIKDIDLFAVANGPGSFTGLRIGVACVKGFAHAMDKPVVGVSTLLGLSYNLSFSDGIVCPIMDARRGEVYNALYKFNDGEHECLRKDRAVSMEYLIYELTEEFRDEKIIFLGDGVAVHGEKIKEMLGERAFFAPPSLNMQRASSLAVCAKKMYDKGEVTTCYDIKCEYLRKSQAEREADEREMAMNRFCATGDSTVLTKKED